MVLNLVNGLPKCLLGPFIAMGLGFGTLKLVVETHTNLMEDVGADFCLKAAHSVTITTS